MTAHMKDVIRKNVNLIDDNKFDDFYTTIVESTSSYTDIAPVTIFLMEKCNMDPTPNLTNIPVGYLFKYSTIEEALLTEGIQSIGLGAYLGTTIKKLSLPRSCNEVMAQAFSGCTELYHVEIRNPDTLIDRSAFTRTNNIQTIYYHGSTDQFTNKEWPAEMIEDSHVICFDGTLHMIKGVART